ncbi:BZ3500_MvSof-1268-A1-R1_Chr1-1g00945 [Microbotryum saponariae]|uniref:BZ3500_MvSof-1268-A1-R1_Chr1-1g00945 protein n=1 Tax=Microbotryum saponariae TaxID=289078 RepID=A0A2X0KA50_9BASI|nr:BZ3500_MvSof-1268-A1-R1_Chr1-1g00945 [Microbotryum saponariae]SCZ92996.1 BZ3501_MvSof-1269-A2-R1_Chr1-1g00542 [Microbotryum saponariae]
MSPRQHALQFLLLVTVAAPLFVLQVGAQVNPVAEKALRFRQRHNLTDVAADSTPTNGTNTTTGDDIPLNIGLSGPSLSLLTIILPAAVGCFIVVLLVVKGYLFMRRDPGAVRDLFFPRAGLKIRWLGINIAPIAERPPSGPPPRYSRGLLSVFRNRRQGHDTNGAAIEEGGRRAGSRDEDDVSDGESGPGAQEEKEGLPSYAIDTELPGYGHVLRSDARQADATVLLGSSAISVQSDQNGASTVAEERFAGSVDYERASRNNPVMTPQPVLLREMAQLRRQTALQSAAWEYASLR